MGCINIVISHVNTPSILSTERIGGMTVTSTLVSKQLVVEAFDYTIHPNVSCSIVCSVAESGNTEVFAAIDGEFLLSDGNKYMVAIDESVEQYITEDGAFVLIDGRTYKVKKNVVY
jgi:hypothetical protein